MPLRDRVGRPVRSQTPPERKISESTNGRGRCMSCPVLRWRRLHLRPKRGGTSPPALGGETPQPTKCDFSVEPSQTHLLRKSQRVQMGGKGACPALS